MPQIALPNRGFDITYERLEDGEVRTTNHYECGCEWSVVWEDITKGRVKEINASEIAWCEEHDPTIPRYDDDWDFETQWEEEWTEEEYERYGDE